MEEQPLTWFEDRYRGGWTGLRPGAEPGPDGTVHPDLIEARITRQADGRRPWLARSRSGWEIDYPDDELGRAIGSMDHVWCRPSPQPTERELAMWGEGPGRRGGKVDNRPIAVPHPGTVPAHERRR